MGGNSRNAHPAFPALPKTASCLTSQHGPSASSSSGWMSCLQTQAHWSRKYIFSCISRSNLQAGALITVPILLQGSSKHSLWHLHISSGTVVACPGQVWACSQLEHDPHILLWEDVWGRKLPSCAKWGPCYSIAASMWGPCWMPYF